MFKKLVVGALATGIALTGGIGAASADTQKAVSSRSKPHAQFLMSILMVNSKELFITQMEYMLIVLMKMFVAGRLRGT